MIEELTNILAQIRSEIKTYEELSALLEQGARDVSAAGSPPSEDLLAAMAAARAEFSSLKNRLNHIEGFASESLTSLKAMEQMVDQRLEEEEQKSLQSRYQQAAVFLDRIFCLRNILPVHQQALEVCKIKARDLKDHLLRYEVKATANLEDLEKSLEPYQALVTLVEAADQLSDENWLELNSLVEKTFGTSLALAASRQKLVMEAAAVQESPVAEIAEPSTASGEESAASPDDSVLSEAAAVSAKKRRPGWAQALLALAIIIAAFITYAYQTQFTFQLDGYRLRTFGVNIKAINKPQASGDTYLMQAIRQKNLEEMQLLLKHGAGLNDRDITGNTPLHIAVQNGFKEGVELLVKSGADLSMKDAHGKSPAELALSLGDADLASLLMPGGVASLPRDTSNARNPFAMQ